MAEEHKKGLDAGLVGNDLENCCRKETACGQCQKTKCIIGYGKQCINDYRQAPKKEVAEGMARIPTMDFKVFDDVELETKAALYSILCISRRTFRKSLSILPTFTGADTVSKHLREILGAFFCHTTP